jgi:hypothetical protein
VFLGNEESTMRSTIVFGIGLALGMAAFTAAGATKPPACAAITFRPLPPGMSDGEQQAGMYKSRHARLELRAEVKQGAPVDYYVTAAGKRVAAAPANLPQAAASCAAAKRMPKPETPTSSCTGQRFTVVVSHEDNQRLALLYGLDGGSWRFCSAGAF